jgi:hypothetical protein
LSVILSGTHGVLCAKPWTSCGGAQRSASSIVDELELSQH